MGKIHMQQWREIPGIELTGFYDPDDKQAESAIALYGLKRYTDGDQLIQDANAIDIVSPTTTHHDIARRALLAGRHVFVEKPLAHTPEEAEQKIFSSCLY